MLRNCLFFELQQVSNVILLYAKQEKITTKNIAYKTLSIANNNNICCSERLSWDGYSST